MKTKPFLHFLFCALIVWIAVGEFVFAFRHPWATETERFLCVWQAMTFQKVEYKEMRPRE